MEVWAKNDRIAGSWLVPFNCKTGKVPDNWNDFLRISKAAVITKKFYAPTNEIQKMISYSERLKNLLTVHSTSSEIIDFTLPVLNFLITFGTTSTVVISKELLVYTAEFFLDEAIMPNERFDRYLNNIVRKSSIVFLIG